MLIDHWPWIPLAIVLPLSAVLFAILIRRATVIILLAFMVAMVINASGLVWLVVTQGPRTYFMGGWQPPLGITLYADGLSALLILMTTIIGLAAGLYALKYFPSNTDDEDAAHRRDHFWPLWMFLLAAMSALFLSRDIFNLYITLELMGLAAVSLVALAGEPVALRASMRYLLVSMAGSLFYLSGVALVYANYGVLDLPGLRAAIDQSVVPIIAISLMTVGLMMKTAIFPFHFWLPPAHANAPTPVSAVLSGLVVKASFYLLVRLWFQGFDILITPVILQILGVMGAMAILWGAFHALKQKRVKLLIAYSTVAQLGYLFLLFPLLQPGEASALAWNGTFTFVIAHAFAKASMFLAAGNILKAYGHDQISDLGEMTRYMPVTVFAFGMAGLSLVGLPPTGGFAAKWLMIRAAIVGGQWWYAVLIAGGGLLAAGYIIRVMSRAFRTVPDIPRPKPLSPLTEWAALGLAVVAVGLGLTAIFPLELLQVGIPDFILTLVGGVP
ncbi:MAG: complex I subunit 5 family protein [Anaerolineales bacterium]